MKAAQAAPVSHAVKTEPSPKRTDILVAGAVALDLNCDYASKKAGDVAPHAHVSNPARIGQSVGGVGHNVALAAHRASTKNNVKLCSMVGDDV
jgi:pseudouridine-5'-phosphate glycosidase/pseudouridine kinase